MCWRVVAASKEGARTSGRLTLKAAKFTLMNTILTCGLSALKAFRQTLGFWGHENINGFDERLLGLANRAREFGEKFGIEAFSASQFNLDENFNGHTISMVLCTAFDE